MKTLVNFKNKLSRLIWSPSLNKNQSYKLDTNQELLLLILSASPTFYGDVKLVKCLYMIMSDLHHQKEAKSPFKYQFHRWDYGPHDPRVYWDLEQLKRYDFLKINYTPEGKTFELTDLAKDKIKHLKTKYHHKTLSCIEKWVTTYNQRHTDDVVAEVSLKARVSDYELGDRMPLVNLTT